MRAPLCKEAVRVLFHILTARGMISIQTAESTRGSRSYPQLGDLMGRNALLDRRTMGLYHFGKKKKKEE